MRGEEPTIQGHAELKAKTREAGAAATSSELLQNSPFTHELSCIAITYGALQPFLWWWAESARF